MDIQQTAKLLNIIQNGCPIELINYIDGLLNESNKIGVEFGKCIRDAECMQIEAENRNAAFDRGFEHGITITKQQHGIKD